MNRVSAFGGLLTAAGLLGYGVGLGVAYPARAFSVTLVMTGLALATMGRAFDHLEVAP